MASELVSLNAGALSVVNRGRIGGVTFRDVMPTSLVDALEPANALGPAHMECMKRYVGRYPFASYGTLSADSNAGFALENQTLSLYPAAFLINAPPAVYEPVMVHELAHQWFGDSVAPQRWSDVWLNEGHATWYEQLYGADKYPEDYDFEETIREYYSQGDVWRSTYGPVAAPFSATNVLDLFNPNVYYGGATALYALRQVVGERTFYEIERRWVRDVRGRVRLDGRLHRARLEGRPPQPRSVPARLALRLQDAGHAGSPGLDGQRAGRRARPRRRARHRPRPPSSGSPSADHRRAGLRLSGGARPPRRSRPPASPTGRGRWCRARTARRPGR